jgi:luciferase family oxidoreductase group 1
MYALRRDPQSAESFPQDVLELQAYLTGKTRVPGVDAVPGKGSNVPLYILGSSLFGARLAAALGLPYAFASHFAPAALDDAIAAYRAEFRPSEQLASPYVIAGANVVAADTTAAAREQQQAIRRLRAIGLFARSRGVSSTDPDGRRRTDRHPSVSVGGGPAALGPAAGRGDVAGSGLAAGEERNFEDAAGFRQAYRLSSGRVLTRP